MKIISTSQAPAAIGPYSQAVDIGSMVFMSGQLPVNPVTGGVPEGIQAQTQQALNNIKAILHEAGLNVADIVKTTVFMKDLSNFALANEVYENFFSENNALFPGRSCVEVARLPKDAEIEIEAVAYRK